MIQIRKINNEAVKPVPVKCIEKDKIKGYCLIPEIYSNIFICSKKRTGKTSLIWKILQKCAGKHTKIIIFASTVNKDDTYKHIIDIFEKKGNPVITFTSIHEGKTDNLDKVIDVLKEQASEENEQERNKKDQEKQPKAKLICNFGCAEDDEDEPKKRKEKYESPEIIFIFDDLSTELRSPSVAKLLKMNRHFKSKVIVSSQYPNDLLPESIKQIDYCLLGPNHSMSKLEKIYTDLDLSISFNEFLDLYNVATEKRYSFLYIDVNGGEFRRNFNERLILK